jgi:hypothetical protein
MSECGSANVEIRECENVDVVLDGAFRTMHMFPGAVSTFTTR